MQTLSSARTAGKLESVVADTVREVRAATYSPDLDFIRTASGSLLEAALQYAGRGWPVFPLHTPTLNGCSCGDPECEGVGKPPRTRHGLSDASTDPAKIRAWWARWP